MMPLISAHGIGMDARFFDHQQQGLQPRQVIGHNMPGFGGTPLEADLTFSRLAGRLAAAIEQTGSACHVLGHSMGGMVALELAATSPNVVRSLVLCNTTPAFGGRDDTFKTQFVSARLAPLEAGKTMAQIAPGSVRAMSGTDTSEEELDRMAELMAETPEAAYRAAIDCLVTFDRREALETLTIPVLLIGGEDDQAAPARTMQRMAEKLPNAQCHILPGGHMTPVEQPERTNDLIRMFLEKVER
jgi:pimeloyl-ACP methyl ester carboxylesterase